MGSILPLFMAVPLAGAAASVMMPWQRVREFLFLVIPVLSIIGGFFLYHQTTINGPIGHNIGLYIGGVAIPFIADAFSAVMIIASSIVTLAANWFAVTSGESQSRFFPGLTLMLSAGAAGALLTGDIFNLFVFIEVMLLPSYALMAMTGTWARLAAGRTFVLTNLTASTLLLAGATFVYATAGTTNLAALAGIAFSNGENNGPIQAALGVVILSFVIKAAVFPVHTWLPRTYPSTSAAVMALFSGLHTKVAIYAIFRIYTVAFGLDPRWDWLIVIICVLSLLVGSFGGLAEGSMRRIIGYQMVGGMPLILIMLAFTHNNAATAFAAAMFYMVHHMITVGSLLLAAGAVEETYGTGKLVRLSGLARREPLLATVFAFGSLSIVGLPPFSGVLGKLQIILDIAHDADAQAWVALIAILIGAFGALLCMLRLWREVFWGKDMETEYKIPLSKILPSAALICLSILMFFAAGPVMNMLEQASTMFIDTPAYTQSILGDTYIGGY